MRTIEESLLPSRYVRRTSKSGASRSAKARARSPIALCGSPFTRKATRGLAPA
jgi:hypothetical protein